MKGASRIAPIGVRLPEELKEKIHQSAKDNGRSMNAEIVNLLEQSLDKSPPNMQKEIEQLLESYERQIKAMQSYIAVKDQAYDLAIEQIALIKEFTKKATGLDIQEFFNKHVDYKAIAEKHKAKDDKQT